MRSAAGTNVVIFAKEDTNEDIQVVAAEVGDDANEPLQFPTGQTFTAQLYKNDRLLSKDGAFAIFMGESFSVWSALSGDQTLTIAIDNTPALTYTFEDQDFIDADTGFNTVAKNSVDAWFCGFNASIVGVAWIGFDQPRSLGRDETGSVAALPIWISFMQRALKGVPEKPFEKPDGVVQVRINEATGLRDDASATSDWFYAEAVPRQADVAFVPVPQSGRTSQDVRNQLF